MVPARLPRHIWSAILAGLLCASVARAHEREPESGPQLILPGNHVVHAGQLAALEWTADDAVSELEILLSLDGGRTYPIWVSPRLEPRACRFVWRVPSYGGHSLRMRIRFNRGGREIEGAPTSSIVVVPTGEPEPLGLPPLAADSERAPRPANDRGESRSWRTDGRCCETTTHLPARRIARREKPHPVSVLPTTGAIDDPRRPSFVPLRA